MTSQTGEIHQQQALAEQLQVPPLLLVPHHILHCSMVRSRVCTQNDSVHVVHGTLYQP